MHAISADLRDFCGTRYCYTASRACCRNIAVGSGYHPPAALTRALLLPPPLLLPLPGRVEGSKSSTMQCASLAPPGCTQAWQWHAAAQLWVRWHRSTQQQGGGRSEWVVPCSSCSSQSIKGVHLQQAVAQKLSCLSAQGVGSKVVLQAGTAMAQSSTVL